MELWQRRELLYTIAWREIRVRYKQSVMGLFWAVFMPLMIVAAGIIVRIAMATVSGGNIDVDDLATVTVKALPWAFFVSAMKFGTNSLVGNSNLVSKIAFPKMIFPLSAVLASGVDMAVASTILLVVLPIAKVPVALSWLLVPVLLFLLFVLTAGITIVLSAANLFFRDVKYLIEVVLTFAIFFTPVLYDVDALGRWSTLIMLNPVAPLLEGLADCLVRGQLPDLGWLLYSAVAALGVAGLGIPFFARLEPLFAETV